MNRAEKIPGMQMVERYVDKHGNAKIKGGRDLKASQHYPLPLLGVYIAMLLGFPMFLADSPSSNPHPKVWQSYGQHAEQAPSRGVPQGKESLEEVFACAIQKR